MQLNISEQIVKGRRQKGLTQEQLADMLGVSAPAVSKWETGSSYPDIQLLSPLARALGITVDMLLSFTQQLDEAQVNELEAQIEGHFRNGYNEGKTQAEQALRQYPNDPYLKLRMAWQMQKWIPFIPEPDEEKVNAIMDRVIELYEQIYASGDTRVEYAAKIVLINFRIAAGQLDDAEQLLNTLPDEDPHKQASMATIYFHRGEYDMAELEQQKILYTHISKANNALSWLAIIAERRGDFHRAIYMNGAEQALQQQFSMDNHTCLMQRHSLLLKAGREKEAAQAFEQMVDAIIETKNDMGDNEYFKRIPIKYNNTPAELRNMMLALFENDKEQYNRPEYAPAIKRLREHDENLI